jgi:nucleotide-binding universal stress UspA family protein
MRRFAPDSTRRHASDSGDGKEDAMKPILLATDGSPSAEEATREAISLAKKLETPLVATAVEHVDPSAYGYYGYGYSQVYSELKQGAHEQVRAALDKVAAQSKAEGVPCETVLLDGPIVEGICQLAEERNPEMLVVGAHGWGPVKRLIFGSVSLGLLHDAPCPVLVARDGTA